MGDRQHRQDVHVYVLDTLPDTLADDGADSDGWEIVDSSPAVAHDHNPHHATHVAGGGDGGDGGDSDDGMLSLDGEDGDSGPPSRASRSSTSSVARRKPWPKAPWDHKS